MPNKFLDTLPDPDFSIDSAGFEAEGVYGQGFVNVKLGSNQPHLHNRTLTGKLINRVNKYPKWDITLNYNPLTKAQFEPINNFLMQKRGSLRPFFVSLPQYKLPKDSNFATLVQFPKNVTIVQDEIAGVTSMEVTNDDWSTNNYTSSGLPSLGDLFNLFDPNDSLHPKAYMITRVETYDAYQSTSPPIGRPGSGRVRIHFSPPLQKATVSPSILIFDTPLIQVTQVQDVQEHSLDVDNLYYFSLKLQETFY